MSGTDEIYLVDGFTGSPVDVNEEINFDTTYTFGAPCDGNEYYYA